MHCSSPLPVLFFSWSEKTKRNLRIQMSQNNYRFAWKIFGHIMVNYQLNLEIIISISFNYIPLPIDQCPLLLSTNLSFSNMQAFFSFEVTCLSSAMPELTFLQLNFMTFKQNFYQLLLTRLFTSMDDNIYIFYSLINKENVEL